MLPLVAHRRLQVRKDIAAVSGPPGLRLIKGFHDEFPGWHIELESAA